MAVGAVSGIATAGGIDDWFYALNKPFFNPPSAVFGPVWTLLYLLMGISLYLILRQTSSPLRTKAIIIFGVQLILQHMPQLQDHHLTLLQLLKRSVLTMLFLQIMI
jgi:tryptophan-rich sensory protein